LVPAAMSVLLKLKKAAFEGMKRVPAFKIACVGASARPKNVFASVYALNLARVAKLFPKGGKRTVEMIESAPFDAKIGFPRTAPLTVTTPLRPVPVVAL